MCCGVLSGTVPVVVVVVVDEEEGVEVRALITFPRALRLYIAHHSIT